MALFHPRHSHEHSEPQSAEEPLGDADYDAEVDLASPSAGQHNRPGDLFAPYAGTVVPEDDSPGYDVDRDTAP